MDATLVIKASLLLLVALAGSRLLGRAAAASRHGLWTSGFVALLVLPVLAAGLPPLYVPLPSPAPTQGRQPMTAARPAPMPAPVQPAIAALPAPQAAAPVQWPSANVLMACAWMTGTAIALGLLASSLLRVRRLRRTTTEVTDPAWLERASVVASELGLRQAPRLRVGSGVHTPMAGGLRRPVVFLPIASQAWSDESRDVVLAHEIAHLASRDPLRHIVMRVALAVYWFHPLAWLAVRKAAAAREEACDARVLAMGTRPSTYARILLELAESLRGPRMAGALPMVERSLLENRLMAILNETRHVASRRRKVAGALAGAVLTISVAAAQPAQPEQPSRLAKPVQPAASVRPVRQAPPAEPAPAQTAAPAPQKAEPRRVERETESNSLRAEIAALRDAMARMQAAVEAMRTQESVLLNQDARLREESTARAARAAQLSDAVERLARQERLEVERSRQRAEIARAVETLRSAAGTQNVDERIRVAIAELEAAIRAVR
jgi:beta-lactamase regulating signal transducer with metallopeptidase domain